MKFVALLRRYRSKLTTCEMFSSFPTQELTSELAIGDTIRVKPTITKPSTGWGAASHKSVGKITSKTLISRYLFRVLVEGRM